MVQTTYSLMCRQLLLTNGDTYLQVVVSDIQCMQEGVISDEVT